MYSHFGYKQTHTHSAILRHTECNNNKTHFIASKHQNEWEGNQNIRMRRKSERGTETGSDQNISILRDKYLPRDTLNGVCLQAFAVWSPVSYRPGTWPQCGGMARFTLVHIVHWSLVAAYILYVYNYTCDRKERRNKKKYFNVNNIGDSTCVFILLVVIRIHTTIHACLIRSIKWRWWWRWQWNCAFGYTQTHT